MSISTIRKGDICRLLGVVSEDEHRVHGNTAEENHHLLGWCVKSVLFEELIMLKRRLLAIGQRVFPFNCTNPPCREL